MKNSINKPTFTFFQASRRKALRTMCTVLVAGAVMPILSFASTAQGASAPTAGPTSASGERTLIVYYSRTGNTRAVAEQIRTLTGGQMVEIQTVNPYPAEHRATTEQAKKELTAGFKPPLTTQVPDMAKYDVIYVGSPNWWQTMAPPMMTFLTEYDFAGKTLVPFMTHGGGGLGRTVQDMKSLCPTAKVLDGLSVRGTAAANAHKDVEAWLRKLGLGE